MAKMTPTTGFVHVGELFVCNCGIPLARNMGGKGYELIRFHDGKQVKIQMQFGDFLKVKCPTCGRGFNHHVIHETIGMSDSVSVSKTPA